MFGNRIGWLAMFGLACATAVLPAQAARVSLPLLGAAPAFELTTQDGERLSLQQQRGKVVVVSFIFTACVDRCPLLTEKLRAVHARLTTGNRQHVRFLSITIDPERDRPEVLERYAHDHRVDLPGWSFLTGTASEIRMVARSYGVAYGPASSAPANHVLLTSLVDGKGDLRVQYLGERFDPAEMVRDIQALIRERQVP